MIFVPFIANVGNVDGTAPISTDTVYAPLVMCIERRRRVSRALAIQAAA